MGRIAVYPNSRITVGGWKSVCGGFRHQNAAIAASARDNPRRAAILEFPAPRDRLIGGKHKHLGFGPGVGNHNRHPPLPSVGPIRPVVRRGALSFENSWSQVSVLIYIDGGGREKVQRGS